MNGALLIRLSMFACVGLMSSTSIADELTGIYHKAEKKNGAYLEIDGPGLIKKIAVTGDVLKQMPDESRVWIEGDIKTRLTGKFEYDSLQQQPTQWRIVFVIGKWKSIAKPFEKPNS